ncbi:helix-turn-helix transcriptional regulator [Lusitaniella coriacea LEGE 07157]|uniref:Helix-turn-helix transcriptional regulator n=1 Tax=Lusitaniella coriacea LEGE 07157 TaxID=945747 RepID=A0A8J7DYV8_9CYAN|nr:AraC family transcriptional regulator [Lusitaniella coriacea]MBE9117710.1 helix-turn-helix transcriptional regulator [Lusitaniella coriacea LEGE 07157]
MTTFSKRCHTRLPYSTWEGLWKKSRQQARLADLEDASDRIAACPSQFATGYKRDIALRNGIELTLHRYEFHNDLILTQRQSEDHEYLEFVFNLSSISRYWGESYVTGKQHYLLGTHTPGHKETVLLAREPTLEVDIHLKLDLLRSIIGLSRDSGESDRVEFLSTDLRRIIQGEPDVFYSPIQTITPAMQVALQQILNCPYRGTVKQMYLESKSIEVLALWLEQTIAANSPPKPSPRQRPSDEIDRLYQAKKILTQQVDNPPSLMALARQVGLNDCTLKRGFREVFGTTVFGYLHQYRLEQARSLLLENRLSVTAIAHRVGYTNLCAFSTAFRKKFGISPRAMQQ